MIEDLISDVEDWSIERGLHKADSNKQFLKITEEVGEVAAAFARSDKDAMRVEIGDVIVTLIIFAQQNKMDLQDCLEKAYEKIENRNGKMINGVFVKQEDL